MINSVRVSNNSLTAMKIIGIAAMLVDHFNTFINPDYSRTLFEIGRIAFPLFAFVLGYNLARIPPDILPRVLLRLLVFGVIATPVYNVLDGGLEYWWPLNILFTLGLGTAVVYLISRSTKTRSFVAPLAAILLLIVGGGLVDYLWVGPALIVVVWRLFSKISRIEKMIMSLILVVLIGMLCHMNDGLATLFTLPIIYLTTVVFKGSRFPRMKWFFYWFYPAHLAVLLWVRSAFY